MPGVASFSERLSEQLAEVHRWVLAAHSDEVKSLQEENDNLRLQLQRIGSATLSNDTVDAVPSDARAPSGGSNPRFKLKRRPSPGKSKLNNKTASLGALKEEESQASASMSHARGEVVGSLVSSVSSSVLVAPEPLRNWRRQSAPASSDISAQLNTFIDLQPLDVTPTRRTGKAYDQVGDGRMHGDASPLAADLMDASPLSNAGSTQLSSGRQPASPIVPSPHVMSVISNDDPFVDPNRLLEDALLEAVSLGSHVATQLADEALQLTPNYATDAILRLLRNIKVDSGDSEERHHPAALFLKRQPREADGVFDRNVVIHDAQPGLRWLFGVFSGMVTADPRFLLPVLTAFMNGMPRDSDGEVMSAHCVTECIHGVVLLLRTGIGLCQEGRTQWEELVFSVFCAACLADRRGPLGRDLHWIHRDSFAAELFLPVPMKFRTNLVSALCAPEKFYAKYMADARYNIHLVDDAFRQALPRIDGGLSDVPVFSTMCFRPEYSGQAAPTICMIVFTPQLLLDLSIESQLLVCKTVAEVSPQTGASHARFQNWLTVAVLERLSPEPVRWCLTTLRRRPAQLESWLSLDGEQKFTLLVRAVSAEDPGRHLSSLMLLCERLGPVCERLSAPLGRIVQKKLTELRADQALLQTAANSAPGSPDASLTSAQALERSERIDANRGRAFLDNRRGIWR